MLESLFFVFWHIIHCCLMCILNKKLGFGIICKLFKSNFLKNTYCIFPKNKPLLTNHLNLCNMAAFGNFNIKT